jgi:hypothetical protein
MIKTIADLVAHLQTLPQSAPVSGLYKTDDGTEIEATYNLSENNFFMNDGGELTIDVEGISFF